MILFKRLPHNIYYFVEVLILLIGFFSVYLLSFNFSLQALTLGVVLASYVLMGVWHHKLHHTLRGRIVIEYVLIAVLIFAVFAFLNIGNL